MATDLLSSPLLPQRPRRMSPAAAWALAIASTLVLLLLLVPALRPSRTRCSRSSLDLVELTLVAAAHDKGAVCLDGSPPGYHLQTGSGTGSHNWLIHLQGGGWCDTIQSCSNRKMDALGSSNFMKAMGFDGILSNDQLQNPDFYNWNRVYVRYCDGASFAGDSQYEDQNGNKLFFRGLRIWEAVLDELMEKGLADSKQALLTGCSAGGLATLLHCDGFRTRFPQEVSVKCLPDAGFFLDAKDLLGKRSMWSVYNGVVHLQNVTKVLPKDCLANKDPAECYFPAELIKSISTPTFIVNSAYDSWQIQNVVAPDGSDPDKSWQSCKADIRKCNSTQMEVLNGFKKKMVNDLKAADDKMDWGWFIDSCFTHCQTVYGSSWKSPISPRLGNNKTMSQTVGDWYFGTGTRIREVDCDYPCNPTCPAANY
ncbi:pectin acetylesterase 5-like isoform X2 [Phragmites australis]|uniref:pectin acetylesterase 5-like isoform X2 n=1 Tax=Phragmites australis TaxID=29695 RepID=UPI002D77D0F9|nr:pectin acetylesterase 5-like isoform X2 [Phragmites australis]